MSIAPPLHFLRRWNTNGIEEEHIAFIRIPFFDGPCQRGLATPGSARQNNKRTCHSLIISSAGKWLSVLIWRYQGNALFDRKYEFVSWHAPASIAVSSERRGK
jgi:hypothetical protein